jgi:hypothetical protein
MATAKQARAKRLSMSERAEQQLELHFPNYHKLWLWLRKANDGYTTVPRTLPFVMQAIDHQSKSQPAGHTLFCLWARSPDHPLLIIENPLSYAVEAGFSGPRAVDTWRRRMKKLRELHFIDVKKGDAGDFNYVLLLNPNVAMEHMHQRGIVQPDLFGRFLTRVTDVGALKDITAIREDWEDQRDALEEQAKAARKALAKSATGSRKTDSTVGDKPKRTPKVNHPPIPVPVPKSSQEAT